ncbi:tRNA (guanine37-N1)-methyltransferase [Methanomicrobium sp. W14]|uniref:class I SAM-dependent methyltransferase n=1 Tax=Methanomicrobium sp. W14 TaxID=2817839 RepID=UPI001AE4CE48|nr:methyltransferase [Methanomicrobium sp. W14]MBP2133767.1 tRNA (guanine37-N1)-methyltransferase [Methanomicrobium sp. W14]
MKEQHWGIKVEKSNGEAVRKRLIALGMYDTEFKPVCEDDFIVFPVVSEKESSGEYIFEKRPKKREPARHELIGGIAVMQSDDPGEAEYLLESRPVIHTVLYSKSPVSGEYRTKDFVVLAGENTTKTHYIEYNNRFVIDLSAAYFSARLANERQRIYSLIEKKERILDMFAGVGPFPVVLSEKASVIYAGDINPGAVALMKENIELNHKKNIIPMLFDALDLKGIFSAHSFDRIIMNLPMRSEEFLEVAFSLCKKGGVIHYYTLQSEKGEMLDTLGRYTKGRICEKVVRSYSPAQHHAVYDINCL